MDHSYGGPHGNNCKKKHFVFYLYFILQVQELAQMGSLLDFLLDNPEDVDPNFHLKLWSVQVAEGN